MLNTENGRLSMIGLFPVPDGIAFDQADTQQMILYREPLAILVGGISTTSTVIGIGSVNQTHESEREITSIVSSNSEITITHEPIKSTSSYVSGINDTEVQILKSMQDFSNITGIGSIYTATGNDANTTSNVVGYGSITVDTIKNVAVQSNVQSNGTIVSNIFINKETSVLTVQGTGEIFTVYIRDFTDTNIIYLNLDTIQEQTQYIVQTTQEQTNKEFTVYANTKPR